MTLTESRDSSGRVQGTMFTCVCGSTFGGQDAALGVDRAADGRWTLWTTQGVWWTHQVALHLEECAEAAGRYTLNWL